MGFEIFSSWTREIAQNVADLRGGTPAKHSMAAEAIFGSKASKGGSPCLACGNCDAEHRYPIGAVGKISEAHLTGPSLPTRQR